MYRFIFIYLLSFLLRHIANRVKHALGSKKMAEIQIQSRKENGDYTKRLFQIALPQEG